MVLTAPVPAGAPLLGTGAARVGPAAAGLLMLLFLLLLRFPVCVVRRAARSHPDWSSERDQEEKAGDNSKGRPSLRSRKREPSNATKRLVYCYSEKGRRNLQRRPRAEKGSVDKTKYCDRPYRRQFCIEIRELLVFTQDYILYQIIA